MRLRIRVGCAPGKKLAAGDAVEQIKDQCKISNAFAFTRTWRPPGMLTYPDASTSGARAFLGMLDSAVMFCASHACLETCFIWTRTYFQRDG